MKSNKLVSIASALNRASACLPHGLRVVPLSLLAMASLNAATIVPGYLNYEYYPGKLRDDVLQGNAGTPSTAGAKLGSDKSGIITSFESGSNFADNYANKISGYFIPPTDGKYVFFIAGDDDSDLFLSTDETPANKKLIAQEVAWSGIRSYLNGGDATSLPEDKRSDLFAASEWPGGGSSLTLTAGKKYYIEAVHHEGGGGDNLAVTYKLSTEADPANGSAPRLVGSVIAANSDTAPNAATLSFSVPPVGGTYYTGQPLSLLAVASSDSTFPILYQWRLNGNPIPGANDKLFSKAAAALADAGSYDVVVSVPGPTGDPVKLTNATPAVVVVKDVPEQLVVGKLKYEYFPGKVRSDVLGGTAGPAYFGGTQLGSDLSGYPEILESGTDFAENYANRFSGLFIPAETGNYVFYIAGDDDSDLYLSTDENPANKKLIARESGWSGRRKYNTVGGGSTLEDKRSDSFAATEWPTGTTINLKSGSRYYIEAVHHEGGGGDNVAVTFRLDTESEDLTADDTEPRVKGNLVGALIPQIFSIGVSSPNYSRFTFSINDSGVSLADPASAKLTFDGVLVNAVTTGKVGSTAVFNYTYPTRLVPGSEHYYTIQASDTAGNPVTSTGIFTVPLPWFPAADLKSPPIKDKVWSSRFIYNLFDANGNAIDVTGLANIMARINQVGTPELTADVDDSNPSVINWAPNGLFADPATYPVELADDFINLNVAHLKIAEESDYTFGVHSDDGFAMRIRGAEVVRVSGNGQIDPADVEAVVHPGDTGDSNTRAVYHLRPGVYRIEFFWWENGGGDFGEIYAAKGNFTNDGDTSTWRLVGDPKPTQELTLLGVDAAGWTVISSDPGGDALGDWATALADLAATGGGAKTYDVLNVGDPDSNAGVLPFPKDTVGVGDDNFALKANANLVVPKDGTYVLGFNSDDGAYLKLAGQTLLEIQQNNTGLSVIGPVDTVTCDCPTGDSGTTVTVALKQGTIPIEVASFEGGGGAYLTARGALLPSLPVNTSDIPPLAKGAAGSTVTTVAALPLTSDPVGTVAPPSVGIGLSAGGAVITFDGTLQSSATVGGTFENVAGATSPYTVPAGTEARYYRSQK